MIIIVTTLFFYSLFFYNDFYRILDEPQSALSLHQFRRRLKFEELFYIQLGLFKMKQIRLEKQKSKMFKNLSPGCGKGTQARKVKLPKIGLFGWHYVIYCANKLAKMLAIYKGNR